MPLSSILRRVVRAIIYRLLNMLRCNPGFCRLEFQHFRRIEQYLADLNSKPKSSVWNLLTTLQGEQSIKTAISRSQDYRIVRLSNPSDDDLLHLDKHGLCLMHMLGNIQVDNQDSVLTDNEAIENSYVLAQHNELITTSFQLEALKKQQLSAICPVTGKTIYSNKSILAEANQPIFYKFSESAEIFYLAIGRAALGYIKLYLYFPRLNTIAFLEEALWSRNEVDQFRSFVIANWQSVSDYFNMQQSSTSAALIDSLHFAHHLWNSLTGVNKLVKPEILDLVKKLIIAAEPLGRIDQLFPELNPALIDRMPTESLPATILKNNIFVIRPGGKTISCDVLKRVDWVAREMCKHSTLVGASDFRKNRWPILWVSIRTGNRTWASQAESIARIANELYKEFPSLGLIIDGYSVPHGEALLSHANEASTIAREIQVASKIEAFIDKRIAIRNNIGMPMHESIVYAHTADCYLSHHGSLQHKIGWIANCPGVVHSNNTVLNTPRQFPAFWARQDTIPPIYIDAIVDVAGYTDLQNNRIVNNLNNYDFDYRVALWELKKILKQIQRGN